MKKIEGGKNRKRRATNYRPYLCSTTRLRCLSIINKENSIFSVTARLSHGPSYRRTMLDGSTNDPPTRTTFRGNHSRGSRARLRFHVCFHSSCDQKRVAPRPGAVERNRTAHRGCACHCARPVSVVHSPTSRVCFH